MSICQRGVALTISICWLWPTAIFTTYLLEHNHSTTVDYIDPHRTQYRPIYIYVLTMGENIRLKCSQMLIILLGSSFQNLSVFLDHRAGHLTWFSVHANCKGNNIDPSTQLSLTLQRPLSLWIEIVQENFEKVLMGVLLRFFCWNESIKWSLSRNWWVPSCHGWAFFVIVKNPNVNNSHDEVH